jgi:hypothetical protein
MNSTPLMAPHAITRLQLSDRASDLDDLTHRLMAENVALLHGRHVAVVEVQVGAADGGGCDLYDDVGRVNDFRIGDGVA